MKILDRYILTTYLKTFFSVFIILMLIFILQTIWLYIKELAGKDLDISIIMKFLIYFMPKLIPLVLPLTILLASIMVFGSFAENYEFAAMKSTGISLQRAMKGLSVFIVGIGITTFFFANNVIPWAEINSYNLRKNIAKLKPAAFIAEGQFNQLDDGFNIKVDKKSGDSDKFLEGVTIHKKGADRRSNTTTIRSKTGEFFYKKDTEVLQLILYNGNYYEDLLPKNSKSRNKKPFAKSSFEKYIINIDLSQLNNVDMDEQSQTDRYSMLDIPGLNKALDSLIEKRQKEHEGISKNLLLRSSLSKLDKKVDVEIINNDSIYKGSLLDIFDTKKKSQLVDVSSKAIVSAKQVLLQKTPRIKNDKIIFNKHIISFHEKFALGFACIILFFVGAPLGALIRKGGIGLPMVIAILLFLSYHFIGIFATNSAKNGEFNPVLASWFSTLVMLPLGIYLTKRATADRGLFEGEGLFEFLKKIFGIKKKILSENTSVFSRSDLEYNVLDKYENKKLISIAKNHRQFGYKAIYRNTALSILNYRGITNEQLKFSGNFIDQDFEKAITLKNTFEEDSKLTFILYIISFVISIPGAILENNKFPLIGNTLIIIGGIIEVLFVASLIKTAFSHSNYKKHTGKDAITNYLFLILLGLPLYFIVYFFQKKTIEKDLLLYIEKNENSKT